MTLVLNWLRRASQASRSGTGQVWPLWNSIFFCFLFVKKIIDMPGGQINDLSSGKHYSLLLATPLSLSQTFEGLFEVTRCSSRALDSPCVLLLELKRSRDSVKGAVLDAEVPGLRHKQLTQTLIVRLLKTHFCTLVLDFEKSTE